MDIVFKIFSASNIIILIISIINYYLFKNSLNTNFKKSLRINLIFGILYFLLNLIENFEIITIKTLHYEYFHFLYTFLFIFIIVRIVAYILIDLSLKKSLNISKLFSDIFKGVLYFIAFMYLLKENGVSVTSIFTTSAILTAVIGLALQNTLNDIVAGIIITTENTLSIGDWIEYEGKIGQITQSSWRYIKFMSLENELYIIPNRDITKNSVKILSTESSKAYFRVSFGVTYDNMPNKVMEITKTALKDVEGIKNVSMFLMSYGDFAVNYDIKFLVEDISKVNIKRSEILTVIFYVFKRNNIEIPIPRYDIFFREYKQQNISTIKDDLSLIELFNGFDENILDYLSKEVIIDEYAKSEIILSQNTENDTFFYIKKGSAEVIVNNNSIAELKEKQFFGEMSLMTGDLTTAAIKAVEDVVVYKIKKHIFHHIFKNNKKVIDSISEAITNRKLQLANLNKTIETDKKDKEKIKTEEKEKLTSKIKSFFVDID